MGKLPRSMRTVARDALRIAEARARRNGPANAEIIPNVEARWYVIQTEPGRATVAVEALSARRFGVYLPELHSAVTARGKTTVRHSAMLSGYLLVRVYDLDRHLRRITACAGVKAIMRHGDGRPVVMTDAEVRHLLSEQDHSLLRAVLPRSARRKRRGQINSDIPEGMMRVSPKSYLGPIDKSPELAQFEKAIGLVPG